MTLGRTSSGAIKIKTDEEGGGLRAVSCGCCGDCRIAAFSPTPIEGAQKFKYVTLESTSSYSVGGFSTALQAWDVQCSVDSEGSVHCMTFGTSQQIETYDLNYKATFYLAPGSCACEVIKATGSEFRDHSIMMGVADYDVNYWFDPANLGYYKRTFVDADWSTWQNADGEHFLDEKNSEATWEYNFCENWDCFASPLTCLDFTSYNYPIVSLPFTYSQPLESGGFKVQERTIVEPFNTYSGAYGYPATFADRLYTYRFTLHDTLKEIWGPDQLEMRP